MSGDVWDAKLCSTFFKLIFGGATGYVCVALLQPDSRGLNEEFFQYPEQLPAMIRYIEESYQDNNVYFCPQLLNIKRRKKEHVKYCPNAWADLDHCDPSLLYVTPSVVLESSPGRYQALWSFEEPEEAHIGESVSMRIAYEHSVDGADRSGWDLTQLLRVPLTPNLKYDDVVVTVVATGPNNYRVDDFRMYPNLDQRRHEGSGIPMPSNEVLEGLFKYEAAGYIEERATQLGRAAYMSYYEPPTDDWSGTLWRLMMGLYEIGASREEVYWISTSAACNKFSRDQRTGEALWGDVCRAYIKHCENTKTVIIPELNEVSLLSDDERARAKERTTFVERYIEWASGLGDAATQYHQAGAFVILSALLAGRVVLPTSFGILLPNLWFMILADTTLTRKSTAMDISVDLLLEIDPDAIMTTDGSIEGLLQGMSMRPGRPSIFLRDEFTGLLESMTKKDYMAGMAETLTKLYDGKMQKRILRKESIEVKKPVLIVFAGGIRSRTQQLLTLEHISSGFMPRFVFLTAESDSSKVQPMGPPIIRDLTGRNLLLEEMADMYRHYVQTVQPERGVSIEQMVRHASLTPEAWERFNQFEADMMKAALASERADILTPVYDRLGKSTLKCAVLVAASETRDNVVVTDLDIIHAISYAEKWREYAIDIINGVGKSASEHEIERVLKTIQTTPGITRSAIMQRFHMTARTADALFSTMEQRNLVTSQRDGRRVIYNAVTGAN